MTYLDNAGRGRDAQNLWGYLFDIHPKSRSQFEFQKTLSGIFKPYGSYMIGKSQSEKNLKTMDLYSIDFSDITYPWLSGLSGGNEYAAAGSAGWQFSQNVASLYKGAVRSANRAEERRKRMIRAQLAREARERRYRYHRNYRW